MCWLSYVCVWWVEFLRRNEACLCTNAKLSNSEPFSLVPYISFSPWPLCSYFWKDVGCPGGRGENKPFLNNPIQCWLQYVYGRLILLRLRWYLSYTNAVISQLKTKIKFNQLYYYSISPQLWEGVPVIGAGLGLSVVPWHACVFLFKVWSNKVFLFFYFLA